MIVDASQVCAVLDQVSVGRATYFQRMFADARLRCKGADGVPDYVDDLDARLAISALRSSTNGALLVVLPDDSKRRSTIAFTAALVSDGLARMAARSRYGTVLHISVETTVRAQLQGVTLGGIGLATVFTQHYTRGDATDVRVISTPGGLHLPRVFLVCAPADPGSIIRAERPLWVAADLGEGARVEWLEDMLSAARAAGIPVIGWTASPFGALVDEWQQHGGSVYCWPRLNRSARRIVAQLRAEDYAIASVTPKVLVGDGVMSLAGGIANATEALVAARGLSSGRLATDGLAVAWRLLRTLEGLPVRLDDYEREAAYHWGTPSVEALSTTLARFVDALDTAPRAFAREFSKAFEALEAVRATMRRGAAPVWTALANLCVGADAPQTVVFSSRTRKEIFRQCLLARFNIGEEDLEAVGTRLSHLGQPPERNGEASTSRFVFLGFPSGERRRFLARYLGGESIDVVLWPHQRRYFDAQARGVGSRMAAQAFSLETALAELGRQLSTPAAIGSPSRLRISSAETLGDDGSLAELDAVPDSVEIWKRPDLASTIAALFQNGDLDEDEETILGGLAVEGGDEGLARSSDLWVATIVELFFGSRRLLLAGDETVNVITRASGRPRLEERYARGLRVGDELLLIRGQQRQTLYELLVSRVHRDPAIARYLQLVERWQDDFARAYAEGQALRGLTEEALLARLRASGSELTSASTIRTWVRRSVLAPNDAEDLLRVAQILSLPFVEKFYRQVHAAGRRLKGLHINLSTRLNRWLASGEAAEATEGNDEDLVDAELGLTVDDFRHSLMRLTVTGLAALTGRFYRGTLGRLEERS